MTINTCRVQRLCIAIARDPAGQRAAERLTARASEAGIAVRLLELRLGDFNDDLRANALRRCASIWHCRSTSGISIG